jgi:hypothetical protein
VGVGSERRAAGGRVASGITLEAGGGGEEDGESEECGAASPNRHGRPARVGSGTDWRRKMGGPVRAFDGRGRVVAASTLDTGAAPALRSLTRVHFIPVGVGAVLV